MALLKEKGLFGIIVANKWMRANYGEPLRKWLKEKHIQEIIDFGDLPVFQGATTYPCIIICKNRKANEAFELVNVKTLQFDSLTQYLEENRTSMHASNLEDAGWNLAGEAEQGLLKKIHAAGMPLGQYVKGKIFRGVLTGLNEAFVIDKEAKERLIQEDERSAEIIKPFLAGKDIKRFQTPSSERYLILFPKGFTNERGNNPKNAWRWLNENYAAIANYLKPFEEAGQKRYDKGEYWWELRACDYYEEFEKPKIIVPAIVQKASYSYDTRGFYSNDKTCIIPTKEKYLLGIISSTTVDFYLKSIASTKQGGYFEYKPMYVSKLPIKTGDEKTKKEISDIVDQLLHLNEEKKQATLHSKGDQIQNRIDYCERRVNEIVYELYGLTEEEIGIVESC